MTTMPMLAMSESQDASGGSSRQKFGSLRRLPAPPKDTQPIGLSAVTQPRIHTLNKSISVDSIIGGREFCISPSSAFHRAASEATIISTQAVHPKNSFFEEDKNDENSKEEESETKRLPSSKRSSFPKNSSLRKSMISLTLHVHEKTVDEGGLLNLFPFFRKNQWQELHDVLIKLKENATPEDIRQVLIARNEKDESPLHIAAWKAPPRLTLLMMDLLPNLERKDYLLEADGDGNTPLHLACANLDDSLEFTVIKNALLLAPEALDMCNYHGDTPLHMLVASQAFKKSRDFNVEAAAEEAIRSLLSMVGPHMVTRQNYNGLTLLHIAVANQAHERVLVVLLNTAPAAAKVRDKREMLPVHYVASTAGGGGIPFTFVQQLINAYPESIICQTQDGDTPLHLLMSNASQHVGKDQLVDRNTTKLAELLIGSVEESRDHDSRNDYSSAFELAPMAALSPIMIQNNEHLTPLHSCALYRTPPQLTRLMMECPLASAASVLTTQFGATALHLACASSRLTNAIANIEALATPQACALVDASARTPLVVAVQNEKSSSSVVKVLCQAYPEACTMETPTGFLPLHLAAQSATVKASVIKALIKAAPKTISAVTRTKNNTALHEACTYGAAVDVIKLLLEKYPEALRLRNKDGELPSALARANRADQEVLDLMEKYCSLEFRPKKLRHKSASSMDVQCGWS